jgi:hypothetical protein
MAWASRPGRRGTMRPLSAATSLLAFARSSLPALAPDQHPSRDNLPSRECQPCTPCGPLPPLHHLLPPGSPLQHRGEEGSYQQHEAPDTSELEGFCLKRPFPRPAMAWRREGCADSSTDVHAQFLSSAPYGRPPLRTHTHTRPCTRMCAGEHSHTAHAGPCHY